MVSALEMQYELMSHTVMFPLESPVINISLLGSVVKAKTEPSSSSAARYLPRNATQNNDVSAISALIISEVRVGVVHLGI